jgi:hypothetical protein
MNRDDIIRIAHETYCSRINLHTDQKASISRLERFAALVAAEEREACARYFEDSDYMMYRSEVAKAIRARGQR